MYSTPGPDFRQHLVSFTTPGNLNFNFFEGHVNSSFFYQTVKVSYSFTSKSTWNSTHSTFLFLVLFQWLFFLPPVGSARAGSHFQHAPSVIAFDAIDCGYMHIDVFLSGRNIMSVWLGWVQFPWAHLLTDNSGVLHSFACSHRRCISLRGLRLDEQMIIY